MEPIGLAVQEAAREALESACLRRRALSDLKTRLESERPPCDACRGPQGLVRVPVDGGMVAVRCPLRGDPAACRLARGDARQAARDRQVWFAERGLPPVYAEARLDLVAAEASAAVASYAEDLPRMVARGLGLFVRGGIGTGKSSILGLVMQAAHEADRLHARFVHCEEMFAQLRRWSDAAEAFVTLHRIVPLLLVDDWGAGYEAAGAVAGFSRLIEDRYAHRRATCISTNMSAADLDAAPEWERVRDRLRERCILVQLTGGTRRRPEWKKEE